MAVLTWLGLPEAVEWWRSHGFAESRGEMVVDAVLCSLDTVPSWGFDHLGPGAGELGVRTECAPPTLDRPPPSHPNGVDGIDHVVYLAPALDRAVALLERVLGEGPRRRFRPRGPQGPEMAFFRVGRCVIEVVGAGRGPALAGVAFRSPDLDATIAAVRTAGGKISDPRPAVQGGRIASVRSAFGVAVFEPARGGDPPPRARIMSR